MQVKMLRTLATAEIRAVPGQIVDLEDDWAQQLIDSGQAEAVAQSAKKRAPAFEETMPEEATDVPPETAKRKRKREG